MPKSMTLDEVKSDLVFDLLRTIVFNPANELHLKRLLLDMQSYVKASTTMFITQHEAAVILCRSDDFVKRLVSTRKLYTYSYQHLLNKDAVLRLKTKLDKQQAKKATSVSATASRP